MGHAQTMEGGHHHAHHFESADHEFITCKQGMWLFLLFFFLALLLFYPARLFETLKATYKRALATAVIILLMMAPNLALLMDQSSLVFPLRALPPNFKQLLPNNGPLIYETPPPAANTQLLQSYGAILFGGGSGALADFVALLSPEGRGGVAPPVETARMFIGLAPYFVVLFGLFYGRDRLKKLWMAILLGFALLILGPSGILHGAVYPLFAPLWFARNMVVFVSFVTFALLYFYVLGANALLRRVRHD